MMNILIFLSSFIICVQSFGHVGKNNSTINILVQYILLSLKMTHRKSTLLLFIAQSKNEEVNARFFI